MWQSAYFVARMYAYIHTIYQANSNKLAMSARELKLHSSLYATYRIDFDWLEQLIGLRLTGHVAAWPSALFSINNVMQQSNKPAEQHTYVRRIDARCGLHLIKPMTKFPH